MPLQVNQDAAFYKNIFHIILTVNQCHRLDTVKHFRENRILTVALKPPRNAASEFKMLKFARALQFFFNS